MGACVIVLTEKGFLNKSTNTSVGDRSAAINLGPTYGGSTGDRRVLSPYRPENSILRDFELRIWVIFAIDVEREPPVG